MTLSLRRQIDFPFCFVFRNRTIIFKVIILIYVGNLSFCYLSPLSLLLPSLCKPRKIPNEKNTRHCSLDSDGVHKELKLLAK